MERKNLEISVIDLIIGAAFSLWRAAFLTDAKRDNSDVIVHGKEFIKLVAEDNMINYLNDKKTRNWTVGYYLNNARYRVKRIQEKCKGKQKYRNFLNSKENSIFSERLLKSDVEFENPKEYWDIIYNSLAKIFEIVSLIVKASNKSKLPRM